jgi:hypothetical protein
MATVYKGCCEVYIKGLIFDAMKKNQEILNYYAGIYKIQDRFPDSYNYLILLELSLSTPKLLLAKITEIIKEVVGRLESEPSPNQH